MNELNNQNLSEENKSEIDRMSTLVRDLVVKVIKEEEYLILSLSAHHMFIHYSLDALRYRLKDLSESEAAKELNFYGFFQVTFQNIRNQLREVEQEVNKYFL